MKRITLLLAALIALVCVQLPAQEHKAGDISVVAAIHTSPEFGIGNYNAGAGLRLFVSPSFSARATFGTTVKNGPDDTKNVNLSGAVLWTMFKTNNTAYWLGPQVFYEHNDPSSNLYSVGGVAGTQFTPWEHISLFFEYGLEVTKIGDQTTVTFGQTTGILGIEIGL